MTTHQANNLNTITAPGIEAKRFFAVRKVPGTAPR
jgi:hypothetical protein